MLAASAALYHTRADRLTLSSVTKGTELIAATGILSGFSSRFQRACARESRNTADSCTRDAACLNGAEVGEGDRVHVGDDKVHKWAHGLQRLQQTDNGVQPLHARARRAVSMRLHTE
jgi:hypothetical protein